MAAAGITVVSPDALLLRLMAAPTLTIVFWRGALSALVLINWLVATHGRGVFKAVRAIGVIGVAAASLHLVTSVLFVAAIKHTAVANVFVIVGAQPLFAAMLSAVFLHERIAKRTWIAGAVVLTGLAIVFWGSLSQDRLLGDLMAFGAMSCVALRYVLFRSARKVDMLPSVVLGGLITAAALAPFCDPFDIDGRDLVLLVLMGAVLMPLGQLLLTAAPRYIPVPEISLIVLLEAVFAPTWVWLALGELPPRETVLGGVLILGTLAAHLTTMLRRSGHQR